MIFVKLAVVAWILFFIVRFFVASKISNIERLSIALNGEMKMTPGRVILFLIFLAAVGLTVASVIWFLFFFGIILQHPRRLKVLPVSGRKMALPGLKGEKGHEKN